MKCQYCSELATVHLTEIEQNGNPKNWHVCEACADKHNLISKDEPVRGVEYVLSLFGRVARDAGCYAEASGLLQDAANKYRSLGQPEAWLEILSEVARTLLLLGRNSEAYQQLQAAVETASQIASPEPRYQLYRLLGQTQMSLGRFDEAVRPFQWATEEAQRVDQMTYCWALISLSNALSASGQYDDALEVLCRALENVEKLEEPAILLALGNALNTLARSEALNQPELRLRAAAAFCRAADVAKRIEPCERDDFRIRCDAFRALGEQLLRLGRIEEALQELQRAEEDAKSGEDPFSHCEVAIHIAWCLAFRQEWNRCLQYVLEAQRHLLAALSGNRWPQGVANLMALYGHYFGLWRVASEQCWLDGNSFALWDGLKFADGVKCVAIREGLRRHGLRDTKKQPTVDWRAAPWDWRYLFMAKQPADSCNLLGTHRAVRGLQNSVAGGSPDRAESVLEFPGEIDEAKRGFCQPVNWIEVKGLLPDTNTVLVVFFFDGDDLVILPLRKDAAGEAQLLHIEAGYFRTPSILPRLRELLELQEGEQYLGHLLDLLKHASRNVPVEQIPKQVDMTPLYTDLYDALRFDELLRLIEPDPKRQANLHLVLIPDGPLYRLPLHAACATEHSPRLYQMVASLRYGLSLRTLELQQRIQNKRKNAEGGDHSLRGVAFANPNRKRETVRVEGVSKEVEKVLYGVIREVEILIEETDSEKWWLHGELEPPDQQAIRANLRERHRTGNVGWTMGHGVDDETAREHGLTDDLVLPDGRQVSVAEASLLMCDGPVSMSRMLAEGYDLSNWRLFNISACLLGRLRELGGSKEVLGYIAVLTLLGCRRVCSALWPISDAAAPEFSRYWIRAFKKHVFGETPPGPHSFAIAFKEALDNFRKAEDGKYDHEFFWAPYTLYGLG